MAVTKADSVYQAPELETGYICILTKPSIPGMRLSVLADKFPRFSHPGQGWISPAPSAQNLCTPDSPPATVKSGALLPPRSGQAGDYRGAARLSGVRFVDLGRWGRCELMVSIA
jgi:hypothetical protein